MSQTFVPIMTPEEVDQWRKDVLAGQYRNERRVCSRPDCERMDIYGRGLCRRHYDQWRRTEGQAWDLLQLRQLLTKCLGEKERGWITARQFLDWMERRV